MSLGKTLKNVFFHEEETTPATAPLQTPPPTAPVISNQPTVATAPAPSLVETRALDEKLQQRLSAAIYEAKGIEPYKALDDMLDSLEDVIADPAARYKKAAQIISKQGYTLPVVLNSIDVAIGALEDQSRLFEAGQKEQFLNSVGALQKAVEGANERIAAKQQQLKQLQQEIADITQKRDADAAAIAVEQQHIDQVQGRFTVVYQAAMREVQGQRATVDQMMKVQS